MAGENNTPEPRNALISGPVLTRTRSSSHFPGTVQMESKMGGRFGVRNSQMGSIGWEKLIVCRSLLPC